MKKRTKIAVLSLVGTLALGGTATAIAFSVKSTQKEGSANVENEYINLSFNNKEATFNTISIARGEMVFKEVNVKIDKRAQNPGTYELNFTYNQPSDVLINIYDSNPTLKPSEDLSPVGTLCKNGLTTLSVDISLEQDIYTSYLQFYCPNEAATVGGSLNVRLASK